VNVSVIARRLTNELRLRRYRGSGVHRRVVQNGPREARRSDSWTCHDRTLCCAGVATLGTLWDMPPRNEWGRLVKRRRRIR